MKHTKMYNIYTYMYTYSYIHINTHIYTYVCYLCLYVSTNEILFERMTHFKYVNNERLSVLHKVGLLLG